MDDGRPSKIRFARWAPHTQAKHTQWTLCNCTANPAQNKTREKKSDSTHHDDPTRIIQDEAWPPVGQLAPATRHTRPDIRSPLFRLVAHQSASISLQQHLTATPHPALLEHSQHPKPATIADHQPPPPTKKKKRSIKQNKKKREREREREKEEE
jgi:hypothetical protein